MTRRKIFEMVIGLVLLIAALSCGWYLTSPRFNQYVRLRIVSELEKVTGGKVEMKDLRWNLSQLELEVHDVTIRGREAPDQLPFAHLDTLYVQAKILSLMQRQIGLRRAIAERPVIHIIVYPDGTTNQPLPQVRRQSKRSRIDQLFELAIDRLELRNGQLVWNDRRMPLDLNANDVKLAAAYAVGVPRYDGQLNIGKLDGKFRDYRPVNSNAEVHFSLSPTEVEVKSLRWSAQQTRLEASGRLADFTDPKLQVAYKLSVDLYQFGNIARVRQLRSGVMEVHGSGIYSLRDFGSSGKVFFRDVKWQQPGMNVTDADFGADFSVSKEQLKLSSLSGRIFGGAVSGNAELQNWLPPSATKAQREQPQTGIARLRLQGVDIASIANALSTRSLPLDRVNAVGAATGTVRATWRGAPNNAVADLSVTIVPPAHAAPSQLPVSAELKANYNAGPEVLNVAKLRLATRGSELSASGILAPNSRLAIALTTTNLGEFTPALEAFHISQLPVELQGSASFKGYVSGRLAAPAVDGRLEVRDFDLLVKAKAATQPTLATAAAKPDAVSTAPKRVHWDLLTTDVEFSPDFAKLKNGRLERARAHIAFDASGTLRKYKFTERSPFKAAVQVKNASVAEMQQIAGLNYPVDGTLNFNLSLNGTKLDPRGMGRLQVSDGTAYQQPFRLLSTDVNFASNEAQLRNINLAFNGARLTGIAAYNLKSEAYRFDLIGSNWNLAELRLLRRAKLRVSGTAGFRAQGSGTTSAPVINASLQLRQVVVNEEAVGDLDAQATTRGTEMALSARSHIEDSEVSLGGTVQLRDDFPASLDLRFTRLDFDPLLRAFIKGRVTQHSLAEGFAQIHGPLRRPRELTAAAELRQFRMAIEGFALENQGPMRFSMANQTLKVESLHVVGDETDLSATGSLPVSKTGAADLRANGRINLKLLQSFNPDLLASGLMTLSLNVGGELSKPSLTGTVQISAAGISFIDLPNGLSDINGSLSFDQDRLQIQTLTARTGGGVLNLGGFISYSNGLFANVTAKGKDIRLRYPAGVSAVADADLRFTGNTKRSTLSGDVTVTKFGLNPRFDFALYLARSNQPAAVPKPDSPLNNLHLDVHVVSTPELQVQTSLAKVSGDADLRVTGTGSRPVVLGRINVVEGDVFFSGTKYHLDRGDIVLANPVSSQPVLNLEASARVRDVDITIGFHGPVAHLTTTYHSDPPLPTADIIALLAMGRTPEEAALNPQPTPSLPETAYNTILSQAADALVSSRVQRLFGVSRIKIDPQIGGVETNPTARVTVEQQVSDKVTLTYVTNLSQSAQQVIQVEVYVNKRFSIVAVRDEFGVFGLELTFRQRK